MARMRLGMFGLIVEDMARSLAFYRLLGVDFPKGSEAKSGLSVEVAPGLRMFWSTNFAALNDPGRAGPAGGYRILVEFFTDEGNAEVDRLYEVVTSAGYRGHRAPFVTDFGAYMAMVDDPDGNTVLITAG